MPNPLTGDFDAVAQVSISTINRLLATMHQNDNQGQGLPSLPHQAVIRVGDKLIGEAIDNVTGVAHVQIGAPSIELIGGAADQFRLQCWVRVRYIPDPGSNPLRQFIHGRLHATFFYRFIPEVGGGASVHAEVIDGTTTFTSEDDQSLDAEIAQQVSAILSRGFKPVDLLLPEGAENISLVHLGSGGKSAVAIPLDLSGAGLAGDPASISQIVLGNSGLAVAISREYIERLIQPALDALKAAQIPFSITVTLGVWPFTNSSTAKYTVTINTATAEWLSGVVHLNITGKATTPAWWAPNANFTVKQDLELKFDVPSETFSINAVGEPDVKVNVNGPFGSLVETTARKKVRSVFIQERDKALAQVQPTLQGALAQKQRLVDLLRQVDGEANASLTQANFSVDGIVLRGVVATSNLKPMRVSFEELPDQNGYTAFETWVPGGRVISYKWRWYNEKLSNLDLLALWEKPVENHEQNYHDRFVLTEAADVPGLGDGEHPNSGDTTENPGDIVMSYTITDSLGPVVLNLGQEYSIRQLCLTVVGAQISPGGNEVTTGETVALYDNKDCAYVVPRPGWIIPEKEFLTRWPKKHWLWRLSPGEPPPFLMDRDEWVAVELGGVDGLLRTEDRPNSLVSFVDHTTLTSTLESLYEAIQQASRDDAGILLALVLPEGSLREIGREAAGRLRSLQRMLGDTMVLIMEDVRESLSGAYSIERTRDGATPLYLLNPRGEVAFQSEHLPETAHMVDVLRERLEESMPPRPQLLRLRVKAGKKAPDFLFSDDRGRFLSLKRFRHRSMLLAFARADSSPSLAVLRRLERLQQRLDRKQTTVVAIIDEGEPDNLERLRREQDLSFILVADTRGGIARQYGISAWPTTIQVEADGTIARINVGADPGALVALARERRERAAERYRNEADSI